MATFMLGFINHDAFFELDDSLVPQLAEMPLKDMFKFVVDNGESIALCTSETDFYLCKDTSLVNETEEKELRIELRAY